MRTCAGTGKQWREVHVTPEFMSDTAVEPMVVLRHMTSSESPAPCGICRRPVTFSILDEPVVIGESVIPAKRKLGMLQALVPVMVEAHGY